MSLFQNENYSISVVDAPQEELRKYGIKVYGVSNRKTGVIEAHVASLPGAIQHAVDLNRQLKEGPMSREQQAEKLLASMGILPADDIAPPSKSN